MRAAMIVTGEGVIVGSLIVTGEGVIVGSL